MIRILADWGNVLAVEKPAGWLSVPGRGDKSTTPIVSHVLGEQLRGKKEKPGEPDLYVVHRLDEGTSGVMLFARTAAAHREINGLFETNKIKKIYWCLVKGAPSNQVVSAPLLKLPSKKNRSIVDEKGKPSETKITVRTTRDGVSLVEARPLTGRSHQIRVHLSHLGAPLLGDSLYGGPSETWGLKWAYPLLHCYGLQFEWPLNQKREAYSQPFGEFRKALEALGITDSCGL